MTLSRQIRLIQNRKPSASEDRSCAFGIVQMQSECRTAVGTEQERVANLNVDLGHQQAREQLLEIYSDLAHLDHQNLRNAVGNLM